jgi:hypothetical protein
MKDQKQLVFLVHGVGDAKPGTFTGAVRPMLQAFGLDAQQVQEFNWHSLVGRPVKEPSWYSAKITKAYLSSIMLTFRVTTINDIAAGGSRKKITVAFGLIADGLILSWCLLFVLFLAGCLVGTSDLIGPLFLFLWKAFTVIFVLGLIIGIFFSFSAKDGSHFRRILVSMLRPIIFVSYAPFLFSLGQSLTQLAIIIVAVSASSAFVFPFIYSGDSHSFQIGLAMSSAGLALGIVGFLLSFSLIVVFAPVLKVVSDIFRYSGNSRYRESLHRGLISASLTLGALKGCRVFLVGHSLGSVIILNSLLRKDNPWGEAEEIVLVTMGSPLYRFFHRFFSESCPSPADIGKRLITKGPLKIWINIFRPFDPVGTSIFKKDCSDLPLRDISTRQFKHLLGKAHADYWSDKAVVDIIAREINSFPKVDRVIPSEVEMKPMFADSPDPSNTSMKNKLINLPFLFIPICIIWIFLSLYSVEPYRKWKSANEIHKVIKLYGDTTIGTLYFSPKTSPRGSDHWSVNFIPLSGKKVTFGLSDFNTDMARLQNQLDYGNHKKFSCRITYYPKNPAVFQIAEYGPPLHFEEYKRSAWLSFLAALLLGGIPLGAITYLALRPVWGLYLGQEPV